MKKLTVFFLWFLIITSAASARENILLITYGSGSLTIEGDNDHEQEIVIRIPETIRYSLYLRIFDADVGGVLDAEFGFGKGWDTQTQFEFYGKNQLKSKVFAIDDAKDNVWHTFARFSPEEGEHVGNYYVFKLRAKGLNGDDGNVFDVFVSRNPDENRKTEGIEIVSYEPTIRLPKKNMTAEMRFPVPDNVPEITVRGFDMARADFRVTTAFRSGIRARSSGQDQWAATKIRLTEIENASPALTGKPRQYALNFTGGKETPNDATFSIFDHQQKGLPIQLPIRIARKQNRHPIPRIRVTCLSDCHSVMLDASGSSDKDGDSLKYYWDFGDGQKGKGIRVTHRYENQNTFEVTLVVADNSGQISSSASEKVSVHVNIPPVAKLQAEKFNVQSSGFRGYQVIAAPGQEIPFDSEGSADADGVITRYSLNFDDGSSSDQKKVTHIFEKAGHYQVSLRVEDDSGHPCNNDTAILNVLINTRPFVEIGADRIGSVGNVLVFDPTDYDTDGEIVRYLWDLGDGTQKEGRKSIHSYTEPGEYVVTLTVEDNSGTQNSSASDQMTVIINDPPVPVAHSNFEFEISDSQILHRAAISESIRFDGSESYDRDGKIIAYSWNFGDDGKGRGAKISHAYTRAGTYTVTLTVQDDSRTDSSDKSVTLTVIVNDPSAPAAGADRRGAVDETLHFDGSESSDADGSIIGYSWDFGDNTRAQGVSVSHAYQQPGTYNVILTVQDDSGTASAKQSDMLTVIVNDPPVANAGKDQRVTASEVQFDGGKSEDPDGKIVSYHWKFGDGSAGAGPTPVHVYGSTGTYTVKLTVTDDSGTISRQADDETTVIVNHKPIADAGPDHIGVPGQTLRFDGSESFDPDGDIIKYRWNFMDGKTGSGVIRSHVFSAPGTYNVQLTVHDDTGHKNAMDTNDAVVFINAAPLSVISYQVSVNNDLLSASAGQWSLATDHCIAAPGQSITFDGGESYDPEGSIAEYRWDFSSSDSESPETATGMRVSRTYQTPGIYSVTLTVTDDSGAGNNWAQDKMLIRVNHPPEARPGKNVATCDRTLRFDGSASADPDGDPLFYLWDFGDGTPPVSGVRVFHTYSRGGMYPVILTVDDGTGLKNSKHAAAFTVTINESPVADAGEDETVCAGDMVLFSGGRSHDPEGGRLKYYWRFSDGTAATGLNPTRVFKIGGTYQVTLTIEDDSGLVCNSSSDQMVVRVADAPVANISTGDLLVCANTEVHFDGSESYDVDGLINRFEWDFGDGITSGGPRADHIYKEPGIYPVRLIITGDTTGACDDKDIAEITVTVQEAPEARFSVPAVIPVGKPVQFDGSASEPVPNPDPEAEKAEIVSYAWDFGDGSSGKGVKTSHSYRKPGRYFVTLAIQTDSRSNCKDVTTQNIIMVNGPPVADAGKDKFVGINEVVVFDGSGSRDSDGSIVEYQWDFGYGQTATGMEVRHQYGEGGRYPVTLKVTDNTEVENNRAVDDIFVTVNKTPRAVISIQGGGSLMQEAEDLGEKRDDFWACANEKILFSAENSADPDGNLLKNKKSRYYWNFGDGKDGRGITVSHKYRMPGQYMALLIVDDGSGVSNSRGQVNRRVIVNHPPRAAAGPDRIVCPGETVTFDGSGSIDRDEVFSDEGPLQYHWDFGSGNVTEGEIVTHIFDEPGQYEVRLTVSDDSETACGTGEDVTIVKVNAAPVAEAGHDRKAFVGGAHDAVLFDASQSYDPDEDPLTCYWDFGDGTRDFGEQVSHTYIKPGVYTVRLRVSDGEGTNCSEVWDQLTVVVRQRENAQ